MKKIIYISIACIIAIGAALGYFFLGSSGPDFIFLITFSPEY